MFTFVTTILADLQGADGAALLTLAIIVSFIGGAFHWIAPRTAGITIACAAFAFAAAHIVGMMQGG